MIPGADNAPTWLRNLFALFHRVDVPLVELVARDGDLDLVLATAGRPRLSVEVRPGAGDERSFATTRRFSISYRGARALGLEERRALERAVTLLERLEGRLPVAWPGTVTLGDAGDPPAEALMRRFPFVTVETVTTPTGPASEVLIRVTPRCNQACAFCSGPTHDEPSGASLRAVLAAVPRALPGALLTLTGGEPTVRHDFDEMLGAALAEPDLAEVQVQTNAVSFASARRVAELPKDPRLRFFVSLHAVDEALYDSLTGSHGQLPLALDGVRGLLGAGHTLTLNTLAVASNLAHLPDLVTALPRLLQGLTLPRLHFSVLICPEYRPAAALHLAPYPELVEALVRATALASELGFAVDPLAASTHAVIPLCLLPEDQRSVAQRRLVVRRGQTGYADPRTPWTKAESCRACAVTGACLGVPAAYARRFGVAGLRPLAG
jgi:pyruvate-formate lyase-activating enzyme